MLLRVREYRHYAAFFQQAAERDVYDFAAHAMHHDGEHRVLVRQLLFRLQPERIGQHLPGQFAYGVEPGGYLPVYRIEFHATAIGTQHRKLNA